MQVIVGEGKLITDLYVKQTDSHQYLDSSSSHPYHHTKSIPYSRALRINWICSENVSFDLQCSELEDWLIKRNYNPTVVRKQILKTRAFSRDTCYIGLKKIKTVIDLSLLLPTNLLLRIFRISLMRQTLFWYC